jgi:hypothetical protein
MITAQISAADIATIGTASITVQDLSSSVQNTDAQTLTVSAPSVDAVAFQINPAHTGSVKFASVSFPTAPSWTVDVGGIPSYALIAQGKIFVTVSLGSGGSQVLALDRVTGAKVWGPVAIGGTANAAYDRGKLLILSSPFASAATMEALDAQPAVCSGAHSYRDNTASVVHPPPEMDLFMPEAPAAAVRCTRCVYF